MRLSADQTNSLWKRFHTDGCQECRSALIERYMHLCSITANRLRNGITHEIEQEDLVSVGHLGLIKAVDQFDPARGIKFETYAIHLIRGAILDYFRESDWVPRLVRDQHKKLKHCLVTLKTTLGRRPTELEIAEAMGLTLEKLDKLLIDISRTAMIPLDAFLMGSDNQSMGDLIARQDDTAFESIVIEERNHALGTSLQRLPQREVRVLGLYYQKRLTFHEIGQVLKVSESRAYQLHTQAIARLRDYLSEREEA